MFTAAVFKGCEICDACLNYFIIMISIVTAAVFKGSQGREFSNTRSSGSCDFGAEEIWFVCLGFRV
jgi:hypothetical protein